MLYQRPSARASARLAWVLAVAVALGACGDGACRDERPRRDDRPFHSFDREIVYHIMVDRFSRDGNEVSRNEATPLTYWGGNIAGVTAKLDYLKDLGITTILLTPVTDSVSYHGYDVLDLRKVNPHFGTLDDYRTLITKCHERGMKILFDFVANHTHGDAPLKKAHPDWFRRPRVQTAKNDPLFPKKWNTISFYGLADLVQENEEVYRYLLDAARFWVEQGIDGFRMDAVTLVSPDFWRRFNADVRNLAKPDFFILGEIYTVDPGLLAVYEPSFDGFTDFQFMDGLKHDFHLAGHAATLSYALHTVQHDPQRHATPFRFIDNHDTRRLQGRISADPNDPTNARRMRLALIALMTSPGVPNLLYGTESLLSNLTLPPNVDFDHARSAMTFDRPGALVPLVQRLAAFRRSFDFNAAKSRWVIGLGSTMVVHHELESARRNVVTVYNFESSLTKMKLDLGMFDGFPKEGAVRDILTNQSFPVKYSSVRLDIPGWDAMVLEPAP